MPVFRPSCRAGPVIRRGICHPWVWSRKPLQFLPHQPGSALPQFLSAPLVVRHNPSDGLPVAATVAAVAQMHLCLLFIHPRAPNLIGLRSAGTMPT